MLSETAKIRRYFEMMTRLFKDALLPSLASVIAVVLLFSPALTSQQLPPAKAVSEASQEITLLFMGDIMQHMPQVDAAWNNEKQQYDYDSCFSFVCSIISDADIAVANLETTLAGKPYSGYPAFSSPDELVTGLIHAGVDIAGTANNHCCDRGKTGIERTVFILDSLGLRHMGTYTNENEYSNNNPLIINKKGFRLAFLNYTYGTNGIPVPKGNVVSLIENDRMLHDLQAARDSQPDKIVVFIHWGEEYQRVPNAFQQETAKFLFDNGADYIIGSHPHVIQPMEWHKADSLQKERIVVWSLGNYISNQRNRYTDGGAMFSLTLRKAFGKTSVAGASYHLTWVYNPVSEGRRQYYILPAAKFENDTLFPDGNAAAAMMNFLDDSRKLLGERNIGIGEALTK
ncbi:MAG TPA: CapA family protein [Bacteroidales bacterium]|nr:CapA family protein [Bacteroidales bacterium]